MDRMASPLAMMGAHRQLEPLGVGGDRLHGAVHEMATPSAQVKSALLLAGIQAEGVTRVVEPVRTRDHTERMLAAMGAPIRVDGNAVEVRRADPLHPPPPRGAGALSPAAFWILPPPLHPPPPVVPPRRRVNP